jgi:hypothetical protein
LAMHSRRSRAAWLSIPALAGAIAALVLPGATSTAAAGAALLAVGAIALLAGHAWGLSISIPSHLTLAGQVWPNLALDAPTFSAAAIGVVLVTAVPALALSGVVLPQLARDVLGERRTRSHALFVGGSGAALVAALVLPAL